MTKCPRGFYVYLFLRGEDSIHGPKYSPYYVGKGRGPRAFAKDGRTVPAPKDRNYIVFVQEGLTEEEAFSLEIYCIRMYGRIDIGTGILRNRTDGGEGTSGLVLSKETRKRMSKQRKGKYPKGHHPLTGRIISMETRRKMSESRKGKSHAPEVRRKMSEKQKGRVQSQKTRRKISVARAWYLYELIDPNGEVYITDNLFDFSKQYKLDNGALNRVVRGLASRHKGWTGRIAEYLR
jgi:Ni/Co efflux regulator RcnB